MADDETPKIHIDADWKAQAQAEKQRLAEKQKESEQTGTEKGPGRSKGSGKPGELPEANFDTLMGTLVSQALLALGAIPDPATGHRIAHLDLARHSIDMLTVLEEKTKGNLTNEESSALAGALYELRARYVEVVNAARAQKA